MHERHGSLEITQGVLDSALTKFQESRQERKQTLKPSLTSSKTTTDSIEGSIEETEETEDALKENKQTEEQAAEVNSFLNEVGSIRQDRQPTVLDSPHMQRARSPAAQQAKSPEPFDRQEPFSDDTSTGNQPFARQRASFSTTISPNLMKTINRLERSVTPSGATADSDRGCSSPDWTHQQQLQERPRSGSVSLAVTQIERIATLHKGSASALDGEQRRKSFAGMDGIESFVNDANTPASPLKSSPNPRLEKMASKWMSAVQLELATKVSVNTTRTTSSLTDLKVFFFSFFSFFS